MGPKYWGTVRKCKNCLLSGPRDLTATPAFKAPWRRREAGRPTIYMQYVAILVQASACRDVTMPATEADLLHVVGAMLDHQDRINTLLRTLLFAGHTTHAGGGGSGGGGGGGGGSNPDGGGGGGGGNRDGGGGGGGSGAPVAVVSDSSPGGGGSGSSKRGGGIGKGSPGGGGNGTSSPGDSDGKGRNPKRKSAE